jgi:hemerythrin-like metal-binding protein
MEIITWRDTFSVQVPSIDEQHKKLVELINDLYNKFYEGIDNQYLETLFSELEKYAVYHFDYEERFMELYGFKGYKEHKQEHESFKKKIGDYKQSLDAGKTKDIIDLVTFLKDWLLKHIMGTDQKYAPLFQEKGLR